MHLVDLKDGGASLEFSENEASAVGEALKRLSAKKTEVGAYYDVLTVGDEQLIYYAVWDEPCLIAKTPSGSDLLRQILEHSPRSKAA